MSMNAHELLGREVEASANMRQNFQQVLAWMMGIQNGQLDIRQFKIEPLEMRISVDPTWKKPATILEDATKPPPPV